MAEGNSVGSAPPPRPLLASVWRLSAALELWHAALRQRAACATEEAVDWAAVVHRWAGRDGIRPSRGWFSFFQEHIPGVAGHPGVGPDCP